MQNINLTGVQISNKLLVSLSTRVPVEVQELIDDVAESNGLDRAKWIRDAIKMKLEVDLGKSCASKPLMATNTANTDESKNVFKGLWSFLTNKKSDVAGRTSSIH